MTARGEAATPDTASAPFVWAAVGVCVGYNALRSGDGYQDTWSVALGAELVPIDRDAYMLWAAALEPRSVRALAAIGERHGVVDVEASIRVLVDGDLIQPLHGDVAEDIWLVTRHRLHRRGWGMGNTRDHPEVFTIAHGIDGRSATVNGIVYAVWASSDGVRSVGDACSEVAYGQTISSDEVAQHVLDALPVMLSAGVVSLDLLADDASRMPRELP